MNTRRLEVPITDLFLKNDLWACRLLQNGYNPHAINITGLGSCGALSRLPGTRLTLGISVSEPISLVSIRS